MLEQEFDGLEVILSDNCSSDRTYEIMSDLARAYVGPHSVRLNRNATNIGFVGHVNLAFKLSSGSFIFYNPGDDISLPGRFKRIWAEYLKTGALLVHTDAIEINDDGAELGLRRPGSDLGSISLRECALSTSLCIGATCGWDKGLIDTFGEIVEADTYDDLVFAFRAMLSGNRIAYVPEPLLLYRVGSGMTNTPVKTQAEKLKSLGRNAKIQMGTLKQRLRDYDHYSGSISTAKIFLLIKIQIVIGLDVAYTEDSGVPAKFLLNPLRLLGYIYGKRRLSEVSKWPLN